jgi:hypothetical protein
VLAALASSVGLAVGGTACLSRLETALVLAPFASSVRLAVPCVASRLLCAALLLTLPPAHGTPDSLHGCRRRNPTPATTRQSQPPPTPLSALNAPLVYTGHHTHGGGSARAGQTLQHVSVKMVNSAWAGDVRWLCSRRGWTGTPPQPPPPGSQAACPSCRSPNPDGRLTRPTPHRCTASTARRRDTLECTCCYEGGYMGLL